MQDYVFNHREKSYHVDGHATRTAIETLILGIDQRLEKRRVHLVIRHGRAVLVEELANQLAIGTVDF